MTRGGRAMAAAWLGAGVLLVATLLAILAILAPGAWAAPRKGRQAPEAAAKSEEPQAGKRRRGPRTRGQESQKPARRQAPQPAAPRSPLDDAGWQLISVLPRDGAPVETPADARPTARFETGRVTGFAGCNRFTGGYTVDGARLTFSKPATTMMTCPDDGVMERETAYLAALPRAARFTIAGDRLTLEDAAGAPLLVFERAKPAELAGSSWRMTFVTDGEEGLVSALGGVEVTAVFDAKGWVTGSTGCNTYRGKFTTQGETLRVVPVVMTKKTCPPDRLAQEKAYLSALRGATRFAVEGDRLALSGAGGARLVSYVKIE